MKRKGIIAVSIITVSLVLVVVCGVAYRFLQILPYPLGGGQYLDSPNGRYEARASDMYDEDFWGRSKEWYEFEILEKSYDGSRRVAKRVRMDPLEGKPVFNMRGNNIISWSSDSSGASFAFQGVVLTLEVDN